MSLLKKNKIIVIITIIVGLIVAIYLKTLFEIGLGFEVLPVSIKTCVLFRFMCSMYRWHSNEVESMQMSSCLMTIFDDDCSIPSGDPKCYWIGLSGD